MRFCIELELENNVIEKDKNRLFISLLKKAFFDFDKKFYQEIYENDKTLRKDFTFSAYLGSCKFNRDDIVLDNKKILLNVSTYNKIEGIMIYNSFLNLKKDKTICSFGKENSIKVLAIRNLKDHPVRNNMIMVKTLSPIVIKEHNGDNHSTFYHDLNTEQGLLKLLENTRTILLKRFVNCYKEIRALNVKLVNEPDIVKVKNYDIVIPATLCILELCGDTRLLDYLLKAGIGSKTNSGFGMLKIV